MTLNGSIYADTVRLDEPAPSELEAHGDASFGDRQVYGLLFTYYGGAVVCQTKKNALIVDSTMEAEAIASANAAVASDDASRQLRLQPVPAASAVLVVVSRRRLTMPVEKGRLLHVNTRSRGS